MICSSGLQLGGRAVEVVGREQPQGDVLDADLLAPAEQRLDVGGARPGGRARCRRRPPWPSAGCRRASRPTCLGSLSVGHPAEHPRLVRRVEHPPDATLPVRHASMVPAPCPPEATAASPSVATWRRRRASRASAATVDGMSHSMNEAIRHGLDTLARDPRRGQAKLRGWLHLGHRAAHAGRRDRADRAVPRRHDPDRVGGLHRHAR